MDLGHGRQRQLGVMGENALLVGFVDLAGGAIEFQAVAIIGNMAAGDHDGGAAGLHRGHRQRRGRDSAAIDRGQPGIGDGLGALGGDERAR